MVSGPQTNLAAGFVDAAGRWPERTALELDGARLTYAELYDRAAAFAAAIQSTRSAGGPPLTAVFAHRSQTAYAGVLGALLAGHGYVPLNHTFPVERTRTMLQRSGARAMIVDASSAEQLDDLLLG